MEGFYANLLTKNIAMGGDVEASAISAYTTGSKRHQILEGGGVRDTFQTEASQVRFLEFGSSRLITLNDFRVQNQRLKRLITKVSYSYKNLVQHAHRFFQW
jgi:hypothetical protein